MIVVHLLLLEQRHIRHRFYPVSLVETPEVGSSIQSRSMEARFWMCQASTFFLNAEAGPFLVTTFQK
jgi:hypothetical protein